MKKYVYLFTTVLLLSIVACKKTTKEVSKTNDFVEFVSHFPKEIISTTDKIKVQLVKPIASSTIPENIITLSPNVKGTVSVEGNTLVFTPTEKLKGNQEYIVTTNLSVIYTGVSTDKKDFVFKVKTKEQVFVVNNFSPQSYDKNWNYIDGVISASDVIETSKLENIVTATYKNKNIPIQFDATEKYASKISFTIDSIQRFENDEKLELSWNGKSINSSSKGERDVFIIGKNNFKITAIDVSKDGNQEIAISFSDPIKTTQNLNGLIAFNNTKNTKFTYKIDKNKVTVFPKIAHKEAVEIEVFSGIKNTDGYSLKENTIRKLFFEQPKPSISFLQSGTILPSSENLKVNFQAVNLKAVDATIYKVYKDNMLQFLQSNKISNAGYIRTVGRPVAAHTINLASGGLQLDKNNAFAIDLADIITPEAGAMYRLELNYNQEYATYQCDGKENNINIVYGKKELNEAFYNSTNYYNNYNYRNYNWNDRENPCTSSYYYNKNISKNIVASNLGVTVKKGTNNSIFIAVTDLLTTKPVKAASVKLVNLQQQEVKTSKTSSDGIARFENVPQAYFAVISKGNNTTYIKLNDGEALSMSKFDVSGIKLQKGIKGYIYGERGVWRPGDNIFLTFVLNDNANPIPDGHPIKFELTNPHGKIIDRKILHKNPDNVYAYTTKTDQDAPTGNWKVKTTVGGAIFNKTIKVETIKPNRLKIKLKTDEEIFTSNTSISGDVEVKWLHGAIAKSLKLDINGKFSPTKTEFKNFKNYNFDDVTKRFKTEEFSIYDGKLSEAGTAKFSIKPTLKSKAPGMLKASFITKAYENGGDFSTDVFSKKLSPFARYVGVESPVEKGSRNYLYTDKEYTFNVASITEKGKPISLKNVEVKIYSLTWRWWWSTGGDNLSRYDGSQFHKPYKQLITSTSSNGKGQFKFKVDENDWGRYLIKVTDKTGKHSTSEIVYFDWPSWYNKKKSNQNNATLLQFTTDKESYKVDEKATVKFPSSVGQRALVTIENGVEVLENFWVETAKNQTEFTFPVLKTYTPNVFVNISLLQKHNETKNDLPIRMYGSMPMLVENPATKLQPIISMPDEIRPEESTTIKVTETNGKPMTYTLALVDDGLLDLTRFKTPNAWNIFFAKQSLGVKTWDIFDDVIGAYGGKINQILSIGGDETEAGSKNKKANRFKPMVTYLGPFTLNAGKTQSHVVNIPKYIGSVRAMVVASDTKKDAYGSAEKTVFVRKPLMILASLPRKITPSETVTLPVTVFAMKDHVKNVSVSLKPNSSFTVVGNKTQTINFKQPDEKMVYFKVKVNDFKGICNVDVIASSGKEKANYSVEIDVVNPNPVTTKTYDIILKGNETKTFNFSSFGTVGTNNASVEFSTLPPMNFTKRLNYLVRYPHGCVEQTTSGAFPQLYLTKLFDLSNEKKASVERNVKHAINRLSGFQLANGGLSYWSGNSNANDWGTTYAGHFLLEAEKQGYVLPIGFKNSWVSYQKQQARNWRKDNRYGNELAQAYRLYTLALATTPDLASMNRLRETKNISNEAKMRLAMAYALIGKKSIANSVLNTLTTENKRRNYYYYGSETRDDAMALETYSLLKDEVKSIKLAKKIADKLSSEKWMSTQTTSYSLLAIAKFVMQNEQAENVNATYSFNGKNVNATTNKSLFDTKLTAIKKENSLEVKNNSNGILYATITSEGILPVGSEDVFHKNLEVYVHYKTKDGKLISPKELQQGTNIVAEVFVKNTSTNTVKNVALTQILPSGWEIVNTRFTDFGGQQNTKVDYTDIRDDRVNYYFSLGRNEQKTFKILLNASYLGDYYLPGTQVEAMYDNDYVARTKGQWIKVVK
ncbi:Ig-like domain-containing alpha-2-macroglobulin family protein [Tenacibaculum sp. 1_MG-2023]|uniref:Ig-like domain-containing alpha-2-macroglobulin family protein n=1 Tax=Tenacibaculum sp. 1_MG-2023 TaxID=3062653 RepID=UPI0026E12F6E|nr:Ig-like domain-containing alpha-2-macroglobulin family protein [Tenacibaculum sp. 1_MG-2023]MDO6599673.1 MG2 domain-containing protein [Tenacibaculum sp. 1_MG-2023]